MLVLTRKKNEAIYVADNVEIRVLEIRGGRVRLGIQAPREIPVTRSELLAIPNTAPARHAAEPEDGGPIGCEVAIVEFMPAVPSMPRRPR